MHRCFLKFSVGLVIAVDHCLRFGARRGEKRFSLGRTEKNDKATTSALVVTHIAGGTGRKARATARAKTEADSRREGQARKAGTVWLEWFPGLKIETWGTRCVGVSTKSKDKCKSGFPKGMTERKARAKATAKATARADSLRE